MKSYLKLLVIQVKSYESKIINEYNLSTKEEVKKKMEKYLRRQDIIGIIVHME